MQTYLEGWAKGQAHREFNRLVDSRAARRIIAAAKADFDFYSHGRERLAFGLIEAKETEHNYRIAREKVPQLPNLYKRQQCGGLGILIVHHSTTEVWRAIDAEWLWNGGDKGSWNLSDLPQHASAADALRHIGAGIFD